MADENAQPIQPESIDERSAAETAAGAGTPPKEAEGGNGAADPPPPKMGRLWRRQEGELRGDPPPPKMGRESRPLFSPLPQLHDKASSHVFYRPFDIELVPGSDGSFTARLARSDANSFPEVSFRFPLTDDEMEMLDSVFRQEADRHSTIRLAKNARSDSGETKSILEALGAKLFRTLFCDEILYWFGLGVGAVQGASRDEGAVGLRVRLVLDPLKHPRELGDVAGLPWEILLNPSDGKPLSRSQFTPVVRRMTSPTPQRSMLVAPPWRILVVAAEPKDLPILELHQELAAIQERVKGRPSFEVESLLNPSLEELRAEIRRTLPHILHFMGHGRFDEEVGQGLLSFTDADGSALPTGGDALQLEDAARHLPLVVLNTCYSAKLPDQPAHDIYDGVASALVGAGIPAVVAMQYPISDTAAIDFSKGFYDGIANGASVETAVSLGRRQILAADGTSGEWAIPVLYLAGDDGRIFDSSNQEPDPSPKSLAVWSFKPKQESGQPVYGRDTLDSADDLLDLTPSFDGRRIRAHELWKSAVLPDLQEFFLNTIPSGLPVRLYFAAHTTVVFASGYILEAKSGLDITIRQLTPTGPKDYGTVSGGETNLPSWEDFEDVILDSQPGDVAVAVSLTHPVLPDVQRFLELEGGQRDGGLGESESRPKISRIISASIQGGPSNTAVLDGAHALRLAQHLAARIRARSVNEREGTLHLFMAAPNAFVFRLGQLARGFGAIHLYEHDFGGKPGAYIRSLRLP